MLTVTRVCVVHSRREQKKKKGGANRGGDLKQGFGQNYPNSLGQGRGITENWVITRSGNFGNQNEGDIMILAPTFERNANPIALNRRSIVRITGPPDSYVW